MSTLISDNLGAEFKADLKAQSKTFTCYPKKC